MHSSHVVATTKTRRKSMSRFRKLSHVVWHCQYHIMWVPKYRYRVLKDRVGFEISKTIRIFAERLGCEVVELNVQEDHVHLLVMVPPKVAIPQLVGTIKGALVTIVDRVSKFTLIKNVDSKQSKVVTEATIMILKPYLDKTHTITEG
ncbi:IS200/IS605 family transposase [Bathymodiolus platifrons methanotrophic gill symbiont]|uniref:IS200/IS605 family transposase n=1 Tax=Bathymodiolus platifrons methanotrophic gill symbiont TaxID=113268 RepID=UPI0030B851CC